MELSKRISISTDFKAVGICGVSVSKSHYCFLLPLLEPSGKRHYVYSHIPIANFIKLNRKHETRCEINQSFYWSYQFRGIEAIL